MAQVKERGKQAANVLNPKSRRRLKKVFTADDLLHLPEAPDGRCYELVEGRLYEMPPPGQRHGRVTLKIGILLEAHAQRHGLGRAIAGDPGFILARNPDTVRAPDVAYISYERLPADQEFPLQYNDIVPELVVEVASPSDTSRHIQEKAESWLRAGVQTVWVVYPDTRQVTVYRAERDAVILQPDDTLDGSPALPGFTCRVAEFFA